MVENYNEKINDLPLSLTPIDLENTDREKILNYFENGVKLEDDLYQSIQSEHLFFEKWEKFRHPLYFYMIHSAGFFINKILKSGANINSVNKQFESTFAQGIDPALNDSDISLKLNINMSEVRSYRERVFNEVRNWIKNSPIVLPIKKDSSLWALIMSMEHQRIHIETSSVIIRQAPEEFLSRPSKWKLHSWSDDEPVNNFIECRATRVECGTDYNTCSFSWDNEVGQTIEEIPPFLVSRNLISNSEFFDFVKDNGYEENTYWTDDGIAWRESVNALYPLFWVKEKKGYKYRSTFETHSFPYNWPVEVNFHEAKAFAKWKSINEGETFRLMRDLEFYAINKVFPAKDSNINLSSGSSWPVNQMNGELNDPKGNVWQWLGNQFYSLPGFEKDDLYPNFSTPYFDSNHKMLLGGSWISMGTQTSSHYRLWFRKHIYQHAGFRLVKESL